MILEAGKSKIKGLHLAGNFSLHVWFFGGTGV
jgi:hypothetical protein